MNPFLPLWEYVPDGEPRVFGDRVYLYGSHDQFGALPYCYNDYTVWSAPVTDLTQWTHHGVTYRKEQNPTNADHTFSMWAPDVVLGGDGRYYLFHGFEFEPRIAVAVADKPEGPFEFYGHVAYPDGALYGTKDGDGFPFDPGVLVDDDGRVYMYIGFVPRDEMLWSRMPGHNQHKGCYVVELTGDMLTVVGEPRLVAPGRPYSSGTGYEGHEFFEAPSMRKIDDTYYLIYSSFLGNELCYATSDHPMKGFEFRGTLVSNGDVGINGATQEAPLNYIANTHGSVVEVEGQWYVFYHRHTNRQQAARQAVAEPIAFDPATGAFTQSEMTSSGLRNAPLPGVGSYPAAIACVLMGANGAGPMPFASDDPERFVNGAWGAVLTDLPIKHGEHPYFTQSMPDREENADQHIANLRDGAVVGFRYFDLTGTSAVELELRGDGTGQVEVATELDGPAVATAPVTGGQPTVVELPAELGERTALYLTFRISGEVSFHTLTFRTA